jgi:hypothetical protein
MNDKKENPANFEGTKNEVEQNDNHVENVEMSKAPEPLETIEEVDENDKSPNRHEGQTEDLSPLPDLPELLDNVCCVFDERHQEMMLLSSLAVISSVLPNVYGMYGQHKVYPNLYLYVVGKAGSGKGNLVWTKNLISVIERNGQDDPKEQSNGLLERITSKGDQDIPIPKKAEIIIPANSSSSGFTELLSERSGSSLIFETEGDTLANIFKTDYGNYSDVLRKGFHHETISQYRKTDKQYLNIKEPKLSVVISSTAGQLKRIISSAENGLFSRFMFTFTEPIDEFINVFEKKENNLTEVFRIAAERLQVIYAKLESGKGLEFSLTEEQEMNFVEFFNKSKSQLTNMFHEDLDASVNRMGLITFRIAMILTVIRNAEDTLGEQLVCSDEDFKTAIKLSEGLLVSANSAIKLLPSQAEDSLSGSKLNLFRSLPNEFSTSVAKTHGKRYGLGDRTVDRFLKSACFSKLGHGTWQKVEE